MTRAAAVPGATAARLRRWGRIGSMALLGTAIAASPWWGPHAMSQMSFFRLQRVEVHGLRYLSEAEFMKKLAVDTTLSVWVNLGPLEERLLEHPQLLSVTLSRRLPGTIVARVQERQPLALVQLNDRLVAIDDRGATIPVDPAMGTVDVPILQRADTAMIRLLADVRTAQPSLYRRISAISRVGRDELRIDLLTVPVLAMSDVTAARLLDILPVERDLAAKGMRVAELDLRYHGQVIARQIREK